MRNFVTNKTSCKSMASQKQNDKSNYGSDIYSKDCRNSQIYNQNHNMRINQLQKVDYPESFEKGISKNTIEISSQQQNYSSCDQFKEGEVTHSQFVGLSDYQADQTSKENPIFQYQLACQQPENTTDYYHELDLPSAVSQTKIFAGKLYAQPGYRTQRCNFKNDSRIITNDLKALGMDQSEMRNTIQEYSKMQQQQNLGEPNQFIDTTKLQHNQMDSDIQQQDSYSKYEHTRKSVETVKQHQSDDNFKNKIKDLNQQDKIQSSQNEPMANQQTSSVAQKVKNYQDRLNLKKLLKINRRIKFACNTIKDLEFSKKLANKEVERVMSRKLEKIRRNSQEIQNIFQQQIKHKYKGT